MATITAKETRAFNWADFDRSALKVGDEISEVLKNGEGVTFVVIDEGVIGLKNCLEDWHRMNEDWTNKGGWLATEMRRFLNEEIFELLPDDLQAIIRPRVFSYGKKAGEDKLWLFSEVEVFGEHIWGKGDASDKHFEYFKAPANRVKTRGNTGTADSWWERSPYASASSYFCRVNSSGGASCYYASYTRGVCFGFYF